MNNVTRLPDSMERAWRTVSQNMAAALRAVDHDEQTIQYVVGALKPVYLRAARSEFRSEGVADPVAALNDWVEQLVHWMILEIANREIELYQAGLR